MRLAAEWSTHGHHANFSQKKFANGKVGHILAIKDEAKQRLVVGGWRAFYDGRYLGTATSIAQAKALVELHSTLGEKDAFHP